MKRLLVLITALLCLSTPALAFAAPTNPLTDACAANGNAGSTSVACSPNGSDPITGPNGVLKKASLVLGVLAGITAVVIIMVSGFRYITANGDAQKATNARNGIVGAVVGLVIIAASTAVVVFVVSKL